MRSASSPSQLVLETERDRVGDLIHTKGQVGVELLEKHAALHLQRSWYKNMASESRLPALD